MAHGIKKWFHTSFFDSIVPVLTWITITLPLWLSPFHPAIVAYFIIAFDLYFLYSCLETVYYSSLSYSLILRHEKISYSSLIKREKKAQDVVHVVIIPNYKEPEYKLFQTVQRIADTDYPLKNIILMGAYEEREPDVKQKAQALQDRFKDNFKDILFSFHTLVEGEEPGKASNQTAAAKLLSVYCQKKGLDPKNVLVTICDADSTLSPNYFSYLTYEFLNDPDRDYHFYWAPVLLYNNFWKLPFFIRIQATLSSILRLSFLSQKHNLIHISTYSTNLWILQSVHYWDVDIIPEDWHIYLQAFFKHGERVKTIPLYTLTGADAVYAGSLKKTLLGRYDQEKRWAWGVSDIGYALRQSLQSPHIPLWAKTKKIIFLAKNHFMWPVSFFILTLSASIPPLINARFKQTVLGHILPEISGLILTISSSLIVVYVFIDIKLRKKLQVETSIHSLPLMFIQWYFLPIISFFFSSLPALESHTRMIVKKNITYKVTEKV